MRYNK